MKPFNLQAALAGARVVTKYGEEVFQLTYFKTISGHCLCGVVSGEMQSWTDKGKYYAESANQLDLFMANNRQSFWVARVGEGVRLGTYPTKKECQNANPDADGYHEITYEEQL